MTSKIYSLFKVPIENKDAILREISDTLSSGFLNEGIKVKQFSRLLCDFFGNEKVVLVNSCTSALTLALKLSGVKSGAEVITSSQTCIATNTSIIANNGKIVWADIGSSIGTLDIKSVEKNITPLTAAVMCVAWAGMSPFINELRNICDKHNIKLIIDAAQAFGCRYDGLDMSRFADFTCYSFQAIKHLSTGDGGALVCKKDDDFQRAKKLKWFGIGFVASTKSRAISLG
jgi:dTDP-4-amino-4,6-dideoxygalactose transaminase